MGKMSPGHCVPVFAIRHAVDCACGPGTQNAKKEQIHVCKMYNLTFICMVQFKRLRAFFIFMGDQVPRISHSLVGNIASGLEVQNLQTPDRC